MVATGTLSNSLWAQLSLICSSTYYLCLGSFSHRYVLINTLPYLRGAFCRPLEFSPCAAPYFLGLLPENSSYLVLLWLSALSLQLRESAGLCLGYCSLCHNLEILSGKFVGLTSLVSCFSEITFLCWLMSSILKTIVSYFVRFYYFFFLLVVLGRMVNPVPIFSY